MAHPKSDALVLGAGPSGTAAAITLARAGARVVLVDRARFPRAKTCGDALSNRAVGVVRALGAGDAIDRVPHAAVRGALAIFANGERVTRSYGDEPGRIVPRLALDDLLRREAERAGVDVREGVRVRSLVLDGARTTGAVTDAGRLDADVVVAADGPGSVAWSSRGLAYPRGAALGLAATTYVEGLADTTPPLHSEHYFEPALRGGYGWAFPAVDGVSNVGVYLRADRRGDATPKLEALLDDFFARHAERFAGTRRVAPVKTWALPLSGVLSRRALGGPGLLVVGDAARAIDPLTGEGIWQALHTGETAGRLAAEALAKGGVVDATVDAYRRDYLRAIGVPSLVRRGVQDAITLVVGLRAERLPAVRALLQWGYGQGSLEVTKSVSRGGRPG